MEIKEARQEIDRIDEQLTQLFCQRMRLAAQIAAVKLRDNIPVSNTHREQEILQRVQALAGENLAPYAQELYSTLFRLSKKYQQPNIVLIGMPGCGKSSIGQALAQLTGRQLLDTDEMVIAKAGINIPAIFNQFGETTFRDLEQQAVEQAADNSGIIIACGGGTVLREDNCRLLRQRGRFFFIQRELSKLPIAGRPLSVDLEGLYRERLPIYRSLAQAEIDNNDTIEQAACRVLAANKGLTK